MAQLFILAKLRAPIVAVDAEVARVENQLMIDQSDSLCSGSIAVLPLDRDLLPESARLRFGDVLDVSVLDDYAIGVIRGVACAASDTGHVQHMRDGRRVTYGTEGRAMLEVRREGFEEWQQLDYVKDGAPKPPRTEEVQFEDFSYTVECREREVDADFDFVGLREWTYNTRHQLYAVAPTDAKLLIVKTRGEFAPVEESVKPLLGDTACTIMSSERVGVVAVRRPGNPANLYHHIKHRIPPSLVEDFIIFDIGEEVGAKLSGFSTLGGWLERTREAKKQRDVFKPKRHR